MKTKKAVLQISKEVSLPLSAVTQTFAILAKRGAGKSNVAVAMAEEFYKHGAPWVAIDPKGDWWGIRSSKDGKGPGLSIPVFGGLHGDVPLESNNGKIIADLIAEKHMTCVLDTSEFSKAEQTKFLCDFFDRLYRKNNSPLHVFLEEADECAPQRVFREEARLVYLVSKVAKLGRTKGLGLTAITQRSASLNKDVLTQIETLIVMRTTAPQDKAKIKEWVDEHDVGRDSIKTLSSLKNGEGWIWSPHFLGIMEKVLFRRRSTFDSGATPEIGKSLKAAKLADINLDQIREIMSDALEKAAADDPKILRARIAELERQVKLQSGGIPEREVRQRITEAVEADRKTRVTVSGPAVNESKLIADIQKVVQKHGGGAISKSVQPAPTMRIHKSTAVGPTETGIGSLRSGAVRILQELSARYPAGYSKPQVGTLTGFKHKGGTFNTYMSDLKRSGFVRNEGGLIYATDEGIAYLGGAIPSPTSHQEVMQMWSNALRAGAFRMLQAIVECGERGIFKEALGLEVGMISTGGTFNTYLSDLRRNGLIESNQGRLIATDILHPEKVSQ